MSNKILKIAYIILSCLVIYFLSFCSDNSTNNDDTPPDTTGTMLEPPDGECLFILGQADEDEMDAYIAEVKSSPLPAGFAFYTSLSSSATQNDMSRYKTYLDKYPNTVLQLAIWTGAREQGYPGYYLDEIVNGQHDTQILALASACKNFNKPIFIRLGYEFDGWHNAYPPDKYITAYRYFVDQMRDLGVNNVAYVWHSWGVGAYYGTAEYPEYYPALPAGQQVTQELWYPGDDYVNWVAMSVFGIGWENLSTEEVVQWLISFAEDHEKPVMLAETAAINPSGQIDADWHITDTIWFDNVLNLISANNTIKAFTYINVDWMADNPSSTWGDTRIQSAPSYIHDYWRNKIEPFLHADSELYSIINYE